MAALSPAQLKEMVRLRRHGKSASEIARHFDVTPQAIDYRLRTTRARLLDSRGKLHELRGPLPENIRAVVWLHPAEAKLSRSDNGEQLRKVSIPAPEPEPPPPAAPAELVRPAPPLDPPLIPAAGRAVVERESGDNHVRPFAGGGMNAAFGANDRYANARPPADMARYREALASKAKPTAAPPVPLERATSREECRRCGVPGFKGCAHQLPYEAPGPETEPFSYHDLYRPGERRFYGQEAQRREANRKATA